MMERERLNLPVSRRPIKIEVPRPQESVYDSVSIIGPIVIDLVRRTVSAGLEYKLMGHTIREGVVLIDGPARVEEAMPDGRVAVRVIQKDEFTRFWSDLEEIILNKLKPYIRLDKPTQARKGNEQRQANGVNEQTQANEADKPSQAKGSDANGDQAAQQ